MIINVHYIVVPYEESVYSCTTIDQANDFIKLHRDMWGNRFVLGIMEVK